MTEYCRIGEKSRVTYNFKGQPSVTYESDISPIEVTTASTSKNNTSNYNSQGYQITFNSPQGAYGTITAVITDYKIEYVDYGVGHPYTGYYISLIRCGSTTFPPRANGLPEAKLTDTNISVDNSVKCPVPAGSTTQVCNIKISSNGNILFQADGDCPVNFTVGCGDECPDGYCKIDCKTYPGYCCLNEAELQSLITQLHP
ncbi:hypothetical protein [Nostoc sp.]|uniref:hypothetical protein n=1 Tax=Nostoc sp. TaxID=1180 RepID=UPI002FF963F3